MAKALDVKVCDLIDEEKNAVKDLKDDLSEIKQKPDSYRSQMEFDNIRLARDLFDGKVNSIACIGEGTIAMHGQINMIDNVNRILDRVALYLA